MQTTSRRTLLAGAAALPALAVPAFASERKVSLDEIRRTYASLDPEIQAFFRALAKEYADLNPTDDDMDLWQHAYEIIRLWPEHERLRAIENEAGDRLHSFVEERAGITPEMSGEEIDTRFSAAMKSLDRETGHSEKCRAFEAVADPVHDHVSAIEKISTRSISGLAAKAIAAGPAIMGAWDKPIADLDWPDHQMRLLIEATLTAAGVANPFAVAGKAVQS